MTGDRMGCRPKNPALGIEGVHPDEVATSFARRGIFAASGHYYAVAVMEHLDVLEEGGLTRLARGLQHRR